MTTYVLIHGAGDVGWYWHLVEAELRARGHDVVAVDLPCDDEAAGLGDYAQTVVDAIGDRTSLVVVAQSFGGYTAPLVCRRVPVDLLVLVAGMVPLPGESAMEMFEHTGYAQPTDEAAALSETDSLIAAFLHDMPRTLALEALSKGKDQAATPADGRAVAARCVAGCSEPVSLLPQRSRVPGGLDAAGRPRAARHHAGRNR